jgi:hypothetical protein
MTMIRRGTPEARISANAVLCKAKSMVPCCPRGEHATSGCGWTRIIAMAAVVVRAAIVSIRPRTVGVIGWRSIVAAVAVRSIIIGAGRRERARGERACSEAKGEAGSAPSPTPCFSRRWCGNCGSADCRNRPENSQCLSHVVPFSEDKVLRATHRRGRGCRGTAIGTGLFCDRAGRGRSPHKIRSAWILSSRFTPCPYDRYTPDSPRVLRFKGRHQITIASHDNDSMGVYRVPRTRTKGLS